jgi:hypothetical protein
MENPEVIKTVTLRTPNDQLNVMEDGLYEITEVGDYMLNQKNGSPYFIIIDRGLSMPRLCHH